MRVRIDLEETFDDDGRYYVNEQGVGPQFLLPLRTVSDCPVARHGKLGKVGAMLLGRSGH